METKMIGSSAYVCVVIGFRCVPNFGAPFRRVFPSLSKRFTLCCASPADYFDCFPLKFNIQCYICNIVLFFFLSGCCCNCCCFAGDSALVSVRLRHSSVHFTKKKKREKEEEEARFSKQECQEFLGVRIDSFGIPRHSCAIPALRMHFWCIAVNTVQIRFNPVKINSALIKTDSSNISAASRDLICIGLGTAVITLSSLISRMTFFHAENWQSSGFTNKSIRVIFILIVQLSFNHFYILLYHYYSHSYYLLYALPYQGGTNRAALQNN